MQAEKREQDEGGVFEEDEGRVYSRFEEGVLGVLYTLAKEVSAGWR